MIHGARPSGRTSDRRRTDRLSETAQHCDDLSEHGDILATNRQVCGVARQKPETNHERGVLVGGLLDPGVTLGGFLELLELIELGPALPTGPAIGLTPA
jgi:hypothetical protein